MQCGLHGPKGDDEACRGSEIRPRPPRDGFERSRAVSLSAGIGRRYAFERQNSAFLDRGHGRYVGSARAPFGVVCRQGGLSFVRRRFGMQCYWSLAGYAKRRVKKALQFIFDFEDTALRATRQRGLDGIICGHIHFAVIRERDDGMVYVNCGDWVDSCTAIVEHLDGTLELISWGGMQPPVEKDARKVEAVEVLACA